MELQQFRDVDTEYNKTQLSQLVWYRRMDALVNAGDTVAAEQINSNRLTMATQVWMSDARRLTTNMWTNGVSTKSQHGDNHSHINASRYKHQLCIQYGADVAPTLPHETLAACPMESLMQNGPTAC